MKKYLFLLFIPILAWSKQFERFDGQFYNNLYYPRVDIIEWGEQYGELPHIEVHLYSKDKQIELSAVPGDKNGKPVLWLMYDLRFRNERVCRHVLAPSHFKEGMNLYAYRDITDPDYDNIFISSEPVNQKNLVKYEMPPYEPCSDENASNKPGSDKVAKDTSETTNSERSPASLPVQSRSATPSVEPSKKDGKNIGVDYENQAVPFSF